ncbi:MAG: 3-oxoacyl-ACP reductase FabG [Candidatus Marinimicrobia bacterium]|jgi:3-oxoacyl-[acyl-carrier protein] reductase|nr:3-oxoacyl-ACP reductase FabG [Candidatus Neomarinimicrobiota bacterium]MDP7071692.1 3-oxoacyl-ACP reductase FabG [Candidatus Neomarinimicrobiota bacterium]
MSSENKMLTDKVAVITGAAKGIGKAVAALFAEEGAHVAIADFDSKTGKATAEDIGAAASFFEVDVQNSGSVAQLFKDVKQHFGRVDILINNAGILMDSTLKKLDEEKFDRVIDVNLKGVYLCTKEVADIMREQGGGVIVNASSIVGKSGNFGQTNYVASKAGVIGMTKVWAKELARDGIRVNAVAPGFIKTDMTAGIPEHVIEMLSEKIPLGRWGDPTEVAQLYCFLASDLSSYINGETINVDGGALLS